MWLLCQDYPIHYGHPTPAEVNTIGRARRRSGETDWFGQIFDQFQASDAIDI
jgi:hypothetical protein